MAHAGKKFTLGAIGDIGGVLCGLQFLDAALQFVRDTQKGSFGAASSDPSPNSF